MPTLSVRARESIKTGLAVAVAIAIALRMDFLEPAWAGFAATMISLDTAGQSLNKAALRMLGTLLGFVASLTFMSLFPQQRWAMLLALTPYIGLCTYMLAGKKRQYAWFVAGFVCLTIMVHAGTDSLSMFRYAVARLEETALGILVFSLISIFLWPRNSKSDLDAASRALFDTQRELFRAYRGLLAGRGRVEESGPLRLQEVQRLTQLGQALAAAETDTYEVWELRYAWRRFLQQSTVLLETLGRWRTSLPEVRPLALGRLLPDLDAFLADLERRFEQIERMLAGREAGGEPRSIELAIDESALRALSNFEKAALVLFRTQLQKLDEISRALFDCLRDIEGSGRIVSKPLREADRSPRLALDPDRFRSAVTVVATMWMGFLLWIWVDPPGHANFWYQATLWSMVAILARQTVLSLLPGFLLALVVGGVAYVGVMPHLSSYTELGLMIFCVTAAGFYLFWEPRRRGSRGFFVAIFLILTSIGNEQTYSFSKYANTSATILMTLALAAAVGYFPSSPRPERVFLRLLARFFRHAEILLSNLAPEARRETGFAERLRRSWCRDDLLDELPEKLATLAQRIDYRLLPGTTPEQVRALVTNLLSLTLRIKEVLDARAPLRLGEPQLEQVVADLREWRLLAQQQFRLWAAEPSAAGSSAAELSERLETGLARFEANLDDARERAAEEGGEIDDEAFYRYLGGFRGVAEAAIGYAEAAAAVNWDTWREARF